MYLCNFIIISILIGHTYNLLAFLYIRKSFFPFYVFNNSVGTFIFELAARLVTNLRIAASAVRIQ